ncbi:aminoacyl-tRNA deacylase [Microvirga sp. 2TAF3]|uniref:aminoacyl-tRNA deacylase n=1 Tax=Microvirga sp. 2TAF3 TaxID=3233014 RepID=UPI003F95C99B
MAIASTLQRYLADQGIGYDLITHEPTTSSTRTAEAGHVSGNSLVKGIVLSTDDGYMLAILPASRHIQLSDLRTELGHEVHLATEQEIEEVFRDCDRGAIPPVGACYGLNVIIDDSLDRHSDLYFEAGDHATLVHMKGVEFARLNPNAQHGSFSTPN